MKKAEHPRITVYRCPDSPKYVPEFLCYHILHGKLDKLPVSIPLECGALYIDVSSFTRITEQASAKGHYGVEIVKHVLNSYYELVQRCIKDNGGEIAKFAGDAVLALFFGDETSSMTAISICGNSIRQGLVRLNRSFNQLFGISIAFHGMANWGKNKLIVFGNPAVHLDYIVYGQGLRQLFSSNVPDTINEIQLQTKHRLQLDLPIRKTILRQKSGEGNPSIFLPAALREAMPQKRFSAELRNVAILFIRMDVRFLGSKDFARNLDRAFQHIQACTYRFDGIVSKTDYNEKGLVVICSFGFPIAHLNDIQRAVFAARAIISYEHKGVFRIGITYSNIYTGFLGSKQRFEYGIVGSGVNAAARLMMEAEPDEILVSSVILPHVEVRFATEYMKKVVVKGFPDPIEIHRITSELPVSHHSLSKLFAAQKIVAWQLELESMVTLCKKKKNATILVSGDPGTGKTFILWQLMTRFQDIGKSVVMLGLEEFNKTTPYHLISYLINQIHGITEPLSQAETLYNLLADSSDKLNMNLLADYFKGMSNEHKTDFDRNIQHGIVFGQLLNLLNILCQGIDALVVDNLHWCDKMSLKLLQAFCNQELKPCNVIITSRFGLHLELFAKPSYRLDLQNLSSAHSLLLINHHLPLIAEEAATYIQKLSLGNPLFITELCSKIRFHQHQHHLITLADIVALERSGALPHTIENLFVQRLTYFSPEIQYLLKLAAIVGKAFTLDEITMMDSEKLKDTVLELLTALDKDNIITRASITPDIVYIFTNNLMREAIYNTILLSEKRDLHLQIATHYEAAFQQNKFNEIEIIANHFILAAQSDKAINYSILAARKNYALSNFEEASYFYNHALGFCTDQEQRTELQLCLVDAQFYHTELEKAESILAGMSVPVPQTESFVKYIYLKSKALYLKAEYKALQELVYSSFINLPVGHYYFLTMIFLADSLRAVNKVAELDTIMSAIRREINKQLQAEAIHGISYQEDSLKGLINAIQHAEQSQALQDTLYYICKLEGINGQLQLNKGHYHKATKHFRHVLAIAQAINDSISRRIALQSLANILRSQGKLNNAMRYFQKAKAICEKTGDRYGYCKVILDIGNLYQQQNNIDAAFEVYQKSLTMAILIGNKTQQQTAIYNIGVIHLHKQEFSEAEISFNQALAIAQEISDNIGISFINDALGDLAMDQGYLDKAEQRYLANLEFQKSIGDTEGMAHSLGNLGNVANQREDFPTAQDYYEQQIAICHDIGDLDGEGKAWYNSAMVAYSNQDYKLCLMKLQKARDTFARGGITLYDEIVNDKISETKALLATETEAHDEYCQE